MQQKMRSPKHGAIRRWAELLKKMRETPPSEELLKILNQTEKLEKAVRGRVPRGDLDF